MGVFNLTLFSLVYAQIEIDVLVVANLFNSLGSNMKPHYPSSS